MAKLLQYVRDNKDSGDSSDIFYPERILRTIAKVGGRYYDKEVRAAAKAAREKIKVMKREE